MFLITDPCCSVRFMATQITSISNFEQTFFPLQCENLPCLMRLRNIPSLRWQSGSHSLSPWRELFLLNTNAGFSLIKQEQRDKYRCKSEDMGLIYICIFILSALQTESYLLPDFGDKLNPVLIT